MSLFAMKKKRGCSGTRRRSPQCPQGSSPREREEVTAARSVIKELHEETACPICLEYFKEPVILDCGHNFCQACLTQCWEETERAPSCPQCREIFQQENFRPNRQLANLVELVRKLQAGKGAEAKWGGCERHQEPLKLFCHDDQAPICVVCDRSIRHRNHCVLPMEEAFLEYKKEIQAQLQFLEREREKLKEEKMLEDQKSQTFLAKLKLEKQVTQSAFQQMHKYLEQQEQLRLSQLETMEGEMEKRDKENHTRFSEEISDLSHLITELEGMFRQTENVFVQDPKTILSSRHEKKPERQLMELPPILEHNLRIYSEQTPELQKALKECEESLDKVLVKALTKVNVTLDRETAHPSLILSEDLKTLTGGGTVQDLPNNAERFDTLNSVLGREKFTSGRHWWEVDMGNGQAVWSVGVARESVKRKGNITLNPDEGFWIVQTVTLYDTSCGRSSWYLRASTSPQSGNLPNAIPQKIRVLLDYEEGRVEFFSSATNEKLFTFPLTTFSGDVLRPYFFIGRTNTLKC
ncbi:PREDICTED: zinc finger protein RFP-like [Gekko japonicus]|uniref:Zinc finger protein RFP-like n=1 Tax=Gekko japonicus TaxID=146911 RepID=A0ABM1KZQ1_GEKJA|nr:PREDICTED: zinc finger protein RFP-like [Gekko japonicus]